MAQLFHLNGQVDTTDTWASLFHQYSSDPNLLRNGFYYFEDIPAGTHQLQVTADGYDLYTADVTMADTFFTFKDVNSNFEYSYRQLHQLFLNRMIACIQELKML